MPPATAISMLLESPVMFASLLGGLVKNSLTNSVCVNFKVLKFALVNLGKFVYKRQANTPGCLVGLCVHQKKLII